MPGKIRISSDWVATGKKRFRNSVIGKSVLEIEEERRIGITGTIVLGSKNHWIGKERRWRDAGAQWSKTSKHGGAEDETVP